MRIPDFAMLFVLAAMWGASFLFYRLASPAFGPLVLTELRLLLAAGALLLYVAAVGLRYMPSGRWKQYLLLGALNAAIPFTLIGIAELHITASLGSILNATTPLFAALAAALWLRESINLPKGVGLVLGLSGVAILIGWSPIHVTVPVALGALASLLAALFYGLGGVYASRTFGGTSPLTVAVGQQVGAAILFLPLAIPGISGVRVSAQATFALMGLALLSTALGYLLYFQLMNRVGPTRTLSVTFLVPVFGLLWGMLFLHESVNLETFVGLAVIFSSIALVSGLLPRPRSSTV